MNTNEKKKKIEELSKLVQQKTDEHGHFQGDFQRVYIALEFAKKEILLPKENA